MSVRTCFRTLFLVIFFLSSPFAILAQQAETPESTLPVSMPKNVIKISPFAWIHGQEAFTVESRIGYERVIGPRSSVAGSYCYFGSNPVFGFIGSVALSATLTTVLNLYGKPGKVGIVWSETKIQTGGYRYQLQYKKYLSKKFSAPEGLYLSPHFSYSEADYSIDFTNFEVRSDLTIKNRNYNLLCGYQALLGKHFVVDVFTGLGYKQKTTEIFDMNGNKLDTIEGSPLKLSSGFNIGWAF